jgi:hypothetical protein
MATGIALKKLPVDDEYLFPSFYNHKAYKYACVPSNENKMSDRRRGGALRVVKVVSHLKSEARGCPLFARWLGVIWCYFR